MRHFYRECYSRSKYLYTHTHTQNGSGISGLGKHAAELEREMNDEKNEEVKTN